MNLEKMEPTEQETIINNIKESLKNVYSGDDMIQKYDKVADFGQYLLKKYPDCSEYALFHVLIGSTPYKISSFFDFPGDDSIAKFVKEQL